MKKLTNRSKPVKRPVNNRSRVSNGKGLFPVSFDARTATGRRFADVIDDISADLGGWENLSALQKALVRRAALLNALSEAEEAKFVTGDPTANIDFYGVACDRIGRIADRLGLRRVPRVINKSLADILTGEPAILTEPAQQ